MRKFNKANFLKEFKSEKDSVCECSYLNPLAGKPIPEGQEIPTPLQEEEELDELVDTDGSMIDGSVPNGDEMNIQTGPIQKPANDFSTFEKGMATTTDKARMATSQGNTWMRAFTGLGGTMYSHGMRGIGDWTSMIGSQSDNMKMESVSKELEESMRDMVEAILDSDIDKDLVSKKGDKDISDKVEIDDLVTRIKDLSADEKEKLGKLLSDAK